MTRSPWGYAPLLLLLFCPATGLAQEGELPEEKHLRERRQRAAEAVDRSWKLIEEYGSGARMESGELRTMARRRLEVKPVWEQPPKPPAVRGEDLDPEEEIEELERYRQRIHRRLAHLAPHRFHQPLPPERERYRRPPPLRFKIIDVRDVTDWAEDHVGPNVGLGVGLDATGLRDTTRVVRSYEEENEDSGTGVDADKLIELLESKLGEDEEEGSIQFTDGRLLIRKSAQALAKIETLLAGLRKSTGHLIDLELKLYRLPPAMFARLRQRATALDADAERVLSEAVTSGDAELLGGHHVIAQDGQRVFVRRGGSRSFVADLAIDVTGSLPVLNPVVNVLNEGLVIEVRPVLARERGLVLLDVAMSLCRLTQPVATREIEGLELELPRLPIARTSSTCWVPVGRGALIGGVFSEKKADEMATVVYVRPRVIQNKKR